MKTREFPLMVALWLTCGTAPAGRVEISGELKKWHAVTVSFPGPQASEDTTPNPFTDYRLIVTFTNGERKRVVHGFFAADGNAANTHATAGNVWQVRFTPDAEGTWRFVASFRTGRNVALSLEPDAGKPGAFDGASDSFTIGPTDKRPPDNRARGLLRYLGGHYLRFAESGEFFLKGGADSPENFLGYQDFDGTYRHARAGGRRKGKASPSRLHRYQPHLRDWRPGDPAWAGGKGKGIIGALNYLASKGMNSVYFLTMNVNGDGKDVWPWTTHTERFRFDCSKLDQWEIVFSHMDHLGIMLHLITQETENDQLLDGGELGPQRRLYYRELVARFAHHPALTWNLGEENTNTDAQRKAFARYIRALDPYDHPIVCHTFPGRYDQVYVPLLGFQDFEGPSLQTNDTHRQTIRWRDRSEVAGRPWVVCLDEIGPAGVGVKPDADDPTHDEVRKRHLWGNLMAGGTGCEWYMGYRFAHNDLNCEDWRSRDAMWDQTRIALEFFRSHLPFTQMRHADSLTSAPDDYCFARPGIIYAIYLPNGGTTRLDLGKTTATFTVQWFNPRKGGPLRRGSVATIRGPGMVEIGPPPAEPKADWVALVRRTDKPLTHRLEVQGGVGSGNYPAGAAIEVAAIPPRGKQFARWTGDTVCLADPNAQTTILLMPDRDARIAANSGGGPAIARDVRVVRFALVDADRDKDIGELRDGATLDLSRLPTRRLNVRAETAPARVGSVRFILDGKPVKTEKAAPYALAGDRDGDYGAWTPSPGTHTLTAIPSAGGRDGKPLTIRFKVLAP